MWDQHIQSLKKTNRTLKKFLYFCIKLLGILFVYPKQGMKLEENLWKLLKIPVARVYSSMQQVLNIRYSTMGTKIVFL